ncbi:hypothetical protein THAOC_24260 [Thalassiosira oceanica]|uniref:Uncharacterized protein n=1 Tax=Thalassiosira oceanica TaxID=159749 RepID=K0SB16_THAOC|nr:hypothetical protein THAOC_24260 [Thalassiosira oceanica]|eukprot:EJK55942.1 hypothetical protein THAOC_24260 [Thalassiosira oceanica]
MVSVEAKTTFRGPTVDSPTSFQASGVLPMINGGCTFDEIGGRPCSRRADVDRRCVLVIVSSHDGERQAHATIEDDYEGVRMPWIHDGAARSDAGGRKVSPWFALQHFFVLKCRPAWLGEEFKNPDRANQYRA